MSDWLHITKESRFSLVIVPDDALLFQNGVGRSYTIEYSRIIERIQNTVKESLLPFYQYSDKIYLTRTNLNNKRDYGEKAIERSFRKAGYKVIAPEKYTVHEQVAMLMHCKELAATDGSIAHNAVFCTHGTNLTIIRKADYWNVHQEVINHLADLNVTYIDAHKSVLANSNSPWWGPFYLCITPELEKFLNLSVLSLPLWLRISWLKYRYLIPVKRSLLYRASQSKLLNKTLIFFYKRRNE